MTLGPTSHDIALAPKKLVRSPVLLRYRAVDLSSTPIPSMLFNKCQQSRAASVDAPRLRRHDERADLPSPLTLFYDIDHPQGLISIRQNEHALLQREVPNLIAPSRHMRLEDPLRVRTMVTIVICCERILHESSDKLKVTLSSLPDLWIVQHENLLDSVLQA
jgi:hypothetical protein